MKKNKHLFILFYLVLVSIISSGQNYNLIDKCYSINFELNESFSFLNCPLEVCITQEITCNNGVQLPITTCSTIYPNNNPNQICLKELEQTFPEQCSIKISQISFRRPSTGETVIITNLAQIQKFEGWLNGTNTPASLHFYKDCEGRDFAHHLIFENGSRFLLDFIP